MTESKPTVSRMYRVSVHVGAPPCPMARNEEVVAGYGATVEEASADAASKLTDTFVGIMRQGFVLREALVSPVTGTVVGGYKFYTPPETTEEETPELYKTISDGMHLDQRIKHAAAVTVRALRLERRRLDQHEQAKIDRQLARKGSSWWSALCRWFR